MKRGAVAGALPNLIVIGAMKAGTSALHYYLDLHPEIAMSRPKELDFFVDGRIADGPDWRFGSEDLRIERGLEANWSRGVDWYRRRFRPDARVRGEASPSYTAPWYPEVAERMAELVPDVRLIFVVRDPVERALSNYFHQRSLGRERRAPEEALDSPLSPYVARSRYALAIQPFLAPFPRERVLILSQEDLRHRRDETVRSVYRFAGVDEGYSSPKLERERYRAEAKASRGPVARLVARSPVMPLLRRLPDEVKWWVERRSAARGPGADTSSAAGLGERLVPYLRDDTRRFGEIAGRSFSEWRTWPR